VEGSPLATGHRLAEGIERTVVAPQDLRRTVAAFLGLRRIEVDTTATLPLHLGHKLLQAEPVVATCWAHTHQAMEAAPHLDHIPGEVVACFLGKPVRPQASATAFPDQMELRDLAVASCPFSVILDL
jgi:hypothetical protein